MCWVYTWTMVGHSGANTLSRTLGLKEWSISTFLTFLNQTHIVTNIREKHNGKMIQLSAAERGPPCLPTPVLLFLYIEVHSCQGETVTVNLENLGLGDHRLITEWRGNKMLGSWSGVLGGRGSSVLVRGDESIASVDSGSYTMGQEKTRFLRRDKA